MEDVVYLNIIDSDEKIPFVLTYGIFKELQAYLNQDSNLFSMFTDVLITETVLKLALSKRNEVGNIVEEFTAYNTITAKDTISLLDFLFDYFANFFSTHQEKVLTLSKKLSEMNHSE